MDQRLCAVNDRGAFIGELAKPTRKYGTGHDLIYPCNRRLLLLWCETILLSLRTLFNAIPPTAERSQELIALNRQLFEQVKAAGGMRYPVDSVPMTQQDWRDHFGPMWETFAMSKRFFDPENLLAPGQGIF